MGVVVPGDKNMFNHLNGKLNPICHSLALLGAHHILYVSRMKVNKSAYVGKKKEF